MDAARLKQRYALVSLDYATSGGDVNFGQAGVDECDWSGVACQNGTVTQVVWSDAGLSGYISAEVGLLRNLTYLDLGENELQGDIPDAIYDLVELEYLYLHQNRLTGTISPLVVNLMKLINLYLNGNQLTGAFPPELGSPSRFERRPMREYCSCWCNVCVSREDRAAHPIFFT